MLCEVPAKKAGASCPCNNRPHFRVNNSQRKLVVCSRHLVWATERLLKEGPLVNVRTVD